MTAPHIAALDGLLRRSTSSDYETIMISQAATTAPPPTVAYPCGSPLTDEEVPGTRPSSPSPMKLRKGSTPVTSS